MPEAYRRSIGPLREEDVELAAVEYMADYYAETEGRQWWPWEIERQDWEKEQRLHSRWPDVFPEEHWLEGGL